MSDEEEWTPDFKRRKITPPTPKQTLKDKYKQRIESSKMPAAAKQEALNRLMMAKDEKSYEWLEQLLKIPFGVYTPLPVHQGSSKNSLKKYFNKVNKTLNEAVYGMTPAKEEVLNYIAQFISMSNNGMPRILGLCSSPGCGKTALIRRGFAKAINRPMHCLSMGGIRDSNYFLGHDFTYVGSRNGILVQALINMKCMNGIIYLDEIDKVSYSSDGLEIQALLLHITDPVQNHSFQDKYFAGIEIDLSKVVFIFSFNDESLIDPVLKDRIHIIHIKDPNMQEKMVIGKQYLLKEIACNVGLKLEDMIISDETVRYIIMHWCNKDKGVRGLKKCLESLLLKINTARYLPQKLQKYKCFQTFTTPFELTIQVVDELLKDMKPEEDKYLMTMYM